MKKEIGLSTNCASVVSSTGVNNVTTDKADDCQKTVKRLENGRIVIESNGIFYNTIGQTIRK